MKKMALALLLIGICVFTNSASALELLYDLPYQRPNGVTYTEVLATRTSSNTYYAYYDCAYIYRNGYDWGISFGAQLSPAYHLYLIGCDQHNENCSVVYDTGTNTEVVGSSLPAPVCWNSDYLATSQSFVWFDNYSSLCGVGDVMADSFFPANIVDDPPDTDYLRYPVDYTLEDNNNWSHNKQSYGSLNNTNSLPHSAEDWNNGSGCDDIGFPLYSIANGTVAEITSGNSTDGWGKTILLRHDAPQGKYFLTGTGEMLTTIYSMYAHMLKYGQDVSYDPDLDIQVQVDDPISKSDPVGQVGNGDGQYPGACHLHFEALTDSSQYRENPYGWSTLSYRTDPSELINNGLYSERSMSFTIVVHPYECTGTFNLDGSAPACSNPPTTIGNWTRRGGNYNPGNPELGYSGIIYSKPADAQGTASWVPNLPRDGRYRVWVYIPNSTPYATSEYATYTVTTNSTSYDPQIIDQSSNPGWVEIGIYNLFQNGDTTVSLQGNTAESEKTIAVDAVKFEYFAPLFF